MLKGRKSMWMLWAVAIAAIAVTAVLLRDIWMVRLPLAVAIRAQARGRKELAAKMYARVIATRALLSDNARRDARFRLSFMLMEKGQYAEAARLLRSNLENSLPPAGEAHIRQRLAEALEGAGQLDEAQAERAHAEQLLSGAKDDLARALASADMLQKQQRFAEAYDLYERGLSFLPRAAAQDRARVMTQLGLAAFNSGRPEDAVRWCEQAIGLKPGLTILTTAYSTAGLGYASLGKLQLSEERRLQALELATNAGNVDAAARFTTQVAETRRRQGRLAEAMQMCERAMGLSLEERRSAYVVQYEILCNWGRFEEAATALQQAQNSRKFVAPSLQRRMEAAYACETAILLAEHGRPDEALPHMQQGLATLREDTKTSTRYRARNVWLLALLGQRDAVWAESAQLEAALDAFAQDRATQRSVLDGLGRAWAVLEDPARSLTYWQRYMALEPDPVGQPKGHYYIGRCLHRLGDHGGAEAALQTAVDLGIDTYDAVNARKLLEQWRREDTAGLP